MSAYAPPAQSTGYSPYTPSPAGTARQPRGFLVINEERIAVISLQTTTNTHFTAASFTATLSQRGQPQGFGALQWDQLAVGTRVGVFFGFLQQGQTARELPTKGNSAQIMLGVIDTIVINRVPNGSVSITGRDLTALLIDSKTANNYQDMTASDAVTMIAKQFNLTPKVTKTTTPIGKYINDQFSTLSNAVAYWDLITDWANQEDYDCYIDGGGTLYFGPPEADTDPSPWVFYARETTPGVFVANCKSLVLTRNANLSKDITVTVLSHNSMTGRSIKVTASRAGTRVPSSSRNSDASTTDNYVFRRPGLTLQQAQNWANAELSAITKYEREFSLSMEGRIDFSAQKKIIIRGTGTDFDCSYYVRSVSLTWERGSGFEMRVTGKNIPPPVGGEDDPVDGGDSGGSDGSDG